MEDLLPKPGPRRQKKQKKHRIHRSQNISSLYGFRQRSSIDSNISNGESSQKSANNDDDRSYKINIRIPGRLRASFLNLFDQRKEISIQNNEEILTGETIDSKDDNKNGDDDELPLNSLESQPINSSVRYDQESIASTEIYDNDKISDIDNQSLEGIEDESNSEESIETEIFSNCQRSSVQNGSSCLQNYNFTIFVSILCLCLVGGVGYYFFNKNDNTSRSVINDLGSSSGSPSMSPIQRSTRPTINTT